MTGHLVASAPNGPDSLSKAIEAAARLLPAQGPIGIFVHHNTLHAFEHLPFEQAVVEAGALLGCEPFLSEARYLEELARGRIAVTDIETVVSEALGTDAETPVIADMSRRELYERILAGGIPEAGAHETAWLVREGDALRAPGARMLFDACEAVVDRAAPVPPHGDPPRVRMRDRLLEATGFDTDELVHPLLIRLCGAVLDQGIASFVMPARERGLFEAFVELFSTEPAPHGDPWMRELARLAREERDCGRDATASLVRSLAALSVRDDEQHRFIVETALALRGWAGMVRQVEERPDRVPSHAPAVSLRSFLAVRLLAERAALTYVARTELGHDGPLTTLQERLPERPAAPERAPIQRAWALFCAATHLELAAEDLAGEDGARLLSEVESLSSLERRRLLHLAYERRHLREVLDAMARHQRSSAEQPSFQAVFCIDDREESLRRHVEEVAPACETLGAAGFFGVAMYFRGIADAHARALCPIVVTPEHEVVEVAIDESSLSSLRRSVGRGVGHVSHGIAVGSRTFVRGTLISALAGALMSVPLVMRVLFPRLSARLSRRGAELTKPSSRTRLAIERRDVAPSLGRWSGYTHQEMAQIVRGQLETMGLSGRLADLVLVVGHGSSSLNNPHESAHDCGACAGGRGGPNARAFAQMANDTEVRALVAQTGLAIPETTWFVGAEHNTCDDEVTFFDADLVPARLSAPLERAAAAMREAARRDAHERCRRFDNAPLWLPPELAKRHVEGRAVDLAQPRPEYGHATNAVCVVGRRGRTRGLFLDRRAFLVSYDPAQDDDEGTVLARLLGAAVPVVAGINLEYYFGYVDPTGYGSGTKLPHNVTGLLGVMDGHQSDLRTGLPWQMLEIHEPVRLLLVIEAPRDRVAAVLAASPALAQLVDNRWVRLAVLDPESSEVEVYERGIYRRYEPHSAELSITASSRQWYGNERGPVPPAAISTGAGVAR